MWSAMLSGPCTPFRIQPVRLVTWQRRGHCSSPRAVQHESSTQHLCRLCARWTAARSSHLEVGNECQEVDGVTGGHGTSRLAYHLATGHEIVAVVSCHSALQVEGAIYARRSGDAATEVQTGSSLDMHPCMNTTKTAARAAWAPIQTRRWQKWLMDQISANHTVTHASMGSASAVTPVWH